MEEEEEEEEETRIMIILWGSLFSSCRYSNSRPLAGIASVLRWPPWFSDCRYHILSAMILVNSRLPPPRPSMKMDQNLL